MSPGRLRRGVTLAGCVAGLAVVSGCHAGPAPPPASQSPGSTSAGQASPATSPPATIAGVPVPGSPHPNATVKPLPTVAAGQPAAAESTVSGQLEFSGGCFYLRPSSGGAWMAVAWPSGYTARTGPLGVYDNHGKLIGQSGLPISLRAATMPVAKVPSGTVHHPECLAGAESVLLVS